MPHPSDLDQRTIASQFARRAKRAHQASVERHFLAAETESRMLERLELIKLEPQRILDVGCAQGHGLAHLHRRYPSAQAIGVDLVADVWPHEGMKAASATMPQWLKRLLPAAGPIQHRVGADASRLPLPEHSVDLLWSNLTWSFLADPPAAAAEWYRVLAPGGLIMMCGFGVDTMAQWRDLAARIGLEQAPDFADMHDVGDLLVASGFADPVMDTERLTLTYGDAQRLIGEVHALGGDARRSRFKGLRTPRARQRWQCALESLRDAEGRIALSVELIFAHAWCPPDKLKRDQSRRLKASGWTPVEIKARKDKN
jgi:malonyl-CoA O-methyltransferase